MAWDETWEKIFTTQEWGKYPSEDLIRFIARNFYKSPKRHVIKILEVGCGTGANIWYLAREGFTVYGIDGSETAIKKARERLDSEVVDWKGELLVGDIMSLPYDTGFFDAVIDNEAIYGNSYEDSIVMCDEVYRVLKPGGKFYSRTFASGSWGDKTGKQVGYHTWIPDEGPMMHKGTSRFSSREDINSLLSKFNIQECEQVVRTYDEMKNKVIEWIVTGIK